MFGQEVKESETFQSLTQLLVFGPAEPVANPSRQLKRSDIWDAQWPSMAGRCPGSPAGDPKLIDKVLELDSQWVPRQNTEAPGG